jgi:hypothetical protein
MQAQPISKLELWTVQQLKEKPTRPQYFPVRCYKNHRLEERNKEGAHQIYLGHLKDRLDEIPEDKKVGLL